MTTPLVHELWLFANRPLTILVLFFLPLWGLAYWRKTYPSQRLVMLAASLALVNLGCIWWSGLWPVILICDLAWISVAVLDVWTAPGPDRFQIQRKTGTIVSLLKRHPVELRLSYTGRRPCAVTLRDDIPAEFTAEPAEHAEQLPARSLTTFTYGLHASRRGSFRQEFVALRVPSRWRLWVRFLELACPQSLQVYPDLQQLSRYALLSRTNRLGLLGVRRTRKIGQDHEFERMRDYTFDDNFKHIDWRASARRNKLTVRDFQASQSQRIMFLIDCGRMMCNRSAGLSLLDHALNATLMLSYVALRQGDRVGILAFDSRVQAYLPPQGGTRQMNRLLHACFDRFPHLVESRYDLAFLHLARACRRRSLVVLMTNVIDDVNARQIENYLASTRGRHIALALLLRDHALFDPVIPRETDDETLYTAAAAAQILTWRRQVLRDLEQRGVLTLDVFPEHMTAPLINRYLEIKARHLL